MSRPDRRFVAIKNVEQQDTQALQRLRQARVAEPHRDVQIARSDC